MPGTTGRSRGRPRKNHAAPATTTHINSFARVSKQAAVEGKDLGDNKPQSHDIDSITSITPSARKRKAARSPEPEETTNTSSQRKIVSASSKSTKKARLLGTEISAPTSVEQPSPSTPRNKSTKKRALSPAPEESPRTKEAGNLFKRLRIDASPFPRAIRAASPLIAPAAETRSSTPATSVVPDDSDENDADASSSSLTTPEPERAPLSLPQELLDLVALYAAFLKTIAVHYAHNGTNTPVDLRDISQAVSIAWGKRRISLADVRRCIGIMDVAKSPCPSPFSLVDYGAKRVCVELRRNGDEQQQRGGPLDEDRLVRVFEGNLRALWDAVGDLVAPDDLRAFVLSLPKANVPSCESVVKASPLLARGQRAMQAIRDDMAAKKEEKETAAATAATTTTNSDVPPPKLSLLERLRLKEARLAALAGSAPTPEQLARVAALQRAADVAAVVAMLAKSSSSSSSGAGGRVSFTMAVVLQRLRDSLRLPVSREEAATCVRVLAAEVAPEWLRIVTVGTKENVVVTVARAPGAGALGERVGRLLGA